MPRKLICRTYTGGTRSTLQAERLSVLSFLTSRRSEDLCYLGRVTQVSPKLSPAPSAVIGTELCPPPIAPLKVVLLTNPKVRKEIDIDDSLYVAVSLGGEGLADHDSGVVDQERDVADLFLHSPS